MKGEQDLTPELAAVLRRIAKAGQDGLYPGDAERWPRLVELGFAGMIQVPIVFSPRLVLTLAGHTALQLAEQPAEGSGDGA